MTGKSISHLLKTAIALPLALAIGACGDKTSESGGLSGEPIAKIAPPAGKAWSETVAKTEAGGYVMGNPEAPIKLIEYGSLTCPHCAAFSQESGEELRSKFVDSGRVSFEFRNFVMNPLDLTMAMMTRCGAPESYFALVSQVFANQQPIIQQWTAAGEAAAMQAAQQPPEKRYIALAQVAGLPEFFGARGLAADQANVCLANAAEAEAMVDRTAKQSEELKITGTPTFLLNGQKIEDNTWAPIKARLEKMGAR